MLGARKSKSSKVTYMYAWGGGRGISLTTNDAN